MNLCYVCSKAETLLEKEETSHLGIRYICHGCIGLRDIIRIRSKKPIILYRRGDYLVNMVGTLSFKIKEETSLPNLNRTVFFLTFKKLWQGKCYNQDDNGAVYCSKVFKSKTTINVIKKEKEKEN